MVLVVLALAVVAVITLLPGLASLRSRFNHVRWEWLALGALLKVLSGLSFVAVFRAVFCSRLSWNLSAEIGLSELGANAVIPAGGAGGLALGAWALRRKGMETERIARRSVAFFFLTSIPNVLGVIVIGFGLALGVFDGRAGLGLTILPALIATFAIALTLASGRWAGRARSRLERSRGQGARLPKVLGALSGGVQESLLLLREHDPWLIVGLIGYLGFDVSILLCTFHAFGSAPPVAIVWIAYLIGELGGLIPIPGGLGGIELGLVGALVLYHVPLGAATAAVLVYRALALSIPAIAGAGAFYLLQRRLARETEIISGCTPGDEIDVIGLGRVRISD